MNFWETEECFASDDPFEIFRLWLEEAENAELNDPNAMALATVDGTGLPDVRMVLLKTCTPKGFVFYTNGNSAKALQLRNNMQAAAVFHWKSLLKQIRLRGIVTQVSREETESYFATRPHNSKIGAWASRQSDVLPHRLALDEAIATYSDLYTEENIPCPPHWVGFCLSPLSIEFWQNRPFRLHDRLRFTRVDTQSPNWTKDFLYP